MHMKQNPYDKYELTHVMELSVVGQNQWKNRIWCAVRFRTHQSYASVDPPPYDQMLGENKQSITLFGRETC